MPVLNIDRIACDGRGICAELLPVDHARRAVAACPALAFRLFERPEDASRVTPASTPTP